MTSQDTNRHHCTAQLDSGLIVTFDGSLRKGRPHSYYLDIGWKFLGFGLMYEVDGIRQKTQRKYGYFCRPENHDDITLLNKFMENV